jgi:ABC-type glutathione transport system ATPase component
LIQVTGKKLEVKNLSITYSSKKSEVQAVDGVSFSLPPGKCLAIVGESGSGKSSIAASILGVLDRKVAKIEGEINWGGLKLLDLEASSLNKIRGSEITMIFQNPSQALHPMFSIENQMNRIRKKLVRSNPLEMPLSISEALTMARLKNTKSILKQYPHELSGGMKQRVMIAMALMGKPQLIVADEPTSALDVTVQLEVVELLRDIISDSGLSLLLISHHLGVVAGLADSVMVLRGGKSVEEGEAEEVLMNPQHEYTRVLTGLSA